MGAWLGLGAIEHRDLLVAIKAGLIQVLVGIGGAGNEAIGRRHQRAPGRIVG